MGRYDVHCWTREHLFSLDTRKNKRDEGSKKKKGEEKIQKISNTKEEEIEEEEEMKEIKDFFFCNFTGL